MTRYMSNIEDLSEGRPIRAPGGTEVEAENVLSHTSSLGAPQYLLASWRPPKVGINQLGQEY